METLNKKDLIEETENPVEQQESTQTDATGRVGAVETSTVARNSEKCLKHPVVKLFAEKLLRRVGKQKKEAWESLRDILVTIDAINALQYPEDKVLDKYEMSEYQIADSLKVLVKPLSLTLGASGYQAVNYLGDVSIAEGIKGTVLSPSRFDYEISSLLACVNPKSTDHKSTGVTRPELAVSDSVMKGLGYVDEDGSVHYYSSDVRGIWTTTLKAYKRMIVSQDDVKDDIAYSWVCAVIADAANSNPRDEGSKKE